MTAFLFCFCFSQINRGQLILRGLSFYKIIWFFGWKYTCFNYMLTTHDLSHLAPCFVYTLCTSVEGNASQLQNAMCTRAEGETQDQYGKLEAGRSENVSEDM